MDDMLSGVYILVLTENNKELATARLVVMD